MPQEQLAVKPYPPCKPQCGWVCHFISCKSFPGFSGGSDGKESVCNAGEPGSIPGWGRCPGGGNGNPLQFSCLENSMDRGTWWAIDHGVTKSWTWLSNQRFLREHIFQGRRGERMKLTEYQWKGRVISFYPSSIFEFLFTFCHKGGVICISEVIDISPGNLDSSLCFFQPSVSPDLLCI